TGLPDPLPAVYEPCLHASGKSAVIQAGNSLYEVDFASGVARSRWTGNGAGGVVYLGDLWGVHTNTGIVVLDPRSDEVREVASLKRKDCYLVPALGNAVMISFKWQKEIAFIGFDGKKLKKLAALKSPLRPMSVDDNVYLTDTNS